MYKIPKYTKTTLQGNPRVEGETIETKIERMVSNKEPITEGAPIIYTEKKDGVVSAYNIRTDRWEIATEAMDVVHRSRNATRDNKPKTEAKKEETNTENNGRAESIQGTNE